jgi:tripartite-type tricarboxylate transporter receptor subunit TctC
MIDVQKRGPHGRRLLAKGLLTVPLLALAGRSAADASDDGRLQLVAGFDTGGPGDVLTRVLAIELGRRWDETVAVMNRGGANGRIAASYARNKAPDGRSLLLADTCTMVLAPLIHRMAGFDPWEDFAAVARLASRRAAIIVPADAPLRDVGAWLRDARRIPEAASVGTSAVGGLRWFIGCRLAQEHERALLLLPYRRSTLLINDVVGGSIAAGIVPIVDALPYRQAGRIRILAVDGARRTPLAPDVATLAELGFRGFESSQWFGLFAPRGTPAAAVERWGEAAIALLSRGDMPGRLPSVGIEADPGSPQALQATLAADVETWRPVVEASGYAVD